MNIILFDGLFAVLLLLSGLLAMIRGFTREALSIASWIAAGFAAWWLYPFLSPAVSPMLKSITQSKLIADGVAAGIVFLITLVILAIVAARIANWIIDSGIGALDRSLGFLFGLARGILLGAAAVLLYEWADPKPPWIWVEQAKSKPMLESAGKAILNSLSGEAARPFAEQLLGEEKQDAPQADEGQRSEEPQG